MNFLEWIKDLFGCNRDAVEEYEDEDERFELTVELLRDRQALNWAFGEKYDVYYQTLRDSWNCNHGELFEINKNDNMYHSLSKIYKAYKQR